MSTSEKELIAGFAKACKVYDTESFNKKKKIYKSFVWET